MIYSRYYTIKRLYTVQLFIYSHTYNKFKLKQISKAT